MFAPSPHNDSDFDVEMQGRENTENRCRPMSVRGFCLSSRRNRAHIVPGVEVN